VTVGIEGLPPNVMAGGASVNAQGVASIDVTVGTTVPTGIVQLRVTASREMSPSSATAALALDIEGAPGELDETFGNRGQVQIIDVSGRSTFRDALVLQDDAFIVTGEDDLGAFVLRLTPNGAVDTTFGTSGRCRFPAPFAAATGVQATSLDLVAGRVYAAVSGGSVGSGVYRVDGGCAVSFPMLAVNTRNTMAEVFHVGSRTPGDLVATGTGDAFGWIATSIRSDGSGRDTSWGSSGLLYEGESGSAIQYVSGPTSDYLVTSVNAQTRIRILTKSGALAGAVPVGAKSTVRYRGGSVVGRELAYGMVDPDSLALSFGRVDLATNTPSYSTTVAIPRLQSDGSRPHAFVAIDGTNYFSVATGGALSVVALDADGKLAPFGKAGVVEVPLALPISLYGIRVQLQGSRLVAVGSNLYGGGAQTALVIARMWK